MLLGQKQMFQKAIKAPVASSVTVQVKDSRGTVTLFAVERKALGQDLWDQCVATFGLIGDTRDHFGLQFEGLLGKHTSAGTSASQRSEPTPGPTARQWLMNDERICDQMGDPRPDPRPNSTAAVSSTVVWQLQFRNKFYVGAGLTDGWSDDKRQLFYLQLRDDVASGRLPVNDDTAIELAGFAAQADFGDFVPAQHGSGQYLTGCNFADVLDASLQANIQARHRRHAGLSTRAAIDAYIGLCQQQAMYGVDLYHCKDSEGRAHQMGLAPAGVTLHRQGTRAAFFAWRDLKNLSFSKKTFVLTLKNEHGDENLSFTLPSKMLTKALWCSAIQCHAFFRLKKNRPTIKTIEAQAANTSGDGPDQPRFERTLTAKSIIAAKRSSLPLDTAAIVAKDVVLPAGTLPMALSPSPVALPTTPMAPLAPTSTPRRHLTLVKRVTESPAPSPLGNVLVPGAASALNTTATSVASVSGIGGKWGHMRHVTLTCTTHDEGFGLGLVGPLDESDPAGIFITSVQPKSPASRAKELLVGDMIISANGIDFVKLLQAAAIQHIVRDKMATGALHLVVVSNPSGFATYAADVGLQGDGAPESSSMLRQLLKAKRRLRSWTTGHAEATLSGVVVEVMHELTIKLGANEALGIGLGAGPPLAGTSGSLWVFVAELALGGAAARDGRVLLGDRLVEVNGEATAIVATASAAWLSRVVQASPVADRVTLVLARFVPQAQVLREYEFHGRHGLHRRVGNSRDQVFVPVTVNFIWVDGTVNQAATEDGSVVVDLAIGQRGFGFDLVGPDSVIDDDSVNDGVFVAVVYAGEPAAASGLVHRGAQVVDINGWAVARASVSQCRALLNAAGLTRAVITLRNDNAIGFSRYSEQCFLAHCQPWLPPPERRRRSVSTVSREDDDFAAVPRRLVVLERSTAVAQRKDWGLFLVGPTADDLADNNAGLVAADSTAEASIRTSAPVLQARGIFISGLVENGVAYRDGRLRVGDQVLEINGQSLIFASHAAAVDALAKSGTQINLLVTRNPVGFRCWQEEARVTGIAKLAFKVPKRDGAARNLVAKALVEAFTTAHVSHPPLGAGVRLVEMPTTDAAGLGFTISGLDEAESGLQPGGVFVSSIVEDSHVHRCGLLHVGDQLLEVNGARPGEWTPLRFASQQQAAAALDGAMDRPLLWLVVAANPAGYLYHRAQTALLRPDTQGYPPLPFFVRALHSWSAAANEVGALSFQERDILEIIAVNDAQWWLVRHVATGAEGRVPSRARAEAVFRRSPAWAGQLARIKSAHEHASADTLAPGRRPSPLLKATMPVIHTYEVVELRRGSRSTPRPVLIVGPEAPLVCETLCRMPAAAAAPHPLIVPAVMHTTRAPQGQEINGVDFHFADATTMTNQIAGHQFIEAGRFEHILFGTSLEAVVQPRAHGRVVLLNTQLAAVTELQSKADIHPLVVFMKPNSAHDIQAAASSDTDLDTAQALLCAVTQTAQDCAALITHVVPAGPVLEETIKSVLAVVQQQATADHYVRVSQVLPRGPAPLAATATDVEAAAATLQVSFAPTAVDVGAVVAQVVLGRTPEGSFGFRVAGGIEQDTLPSVVIKDTTPIMLQGTIATGDVVLTVNDVTVAGETHDHIIALIKASGDKVHLTLLKQPAKAPVLHASEVLALPTVTTADRIVKTALQASLYAMTVPVTSRPPRTNERAGVDYLFVTAAAFELLVADNVLLEWGVQHGYYYGTLRTNPIKATRKRQLGRTNTYKLATMPIERRATIVHENLKLVTVTRKLNLSFGITFSLGHLSSALPVVVALADSMASPAFSGEACVGDILLAVNGVCVAGSMRFKAEELLLNSGAKAELLFLVNGAAQPEGAVVQQFLSPKLEDSPDLRFLKRKVQLKMYHANVPFTTRLPLPTEVNGQDNIFVTGDVFAALLAADAFQTHGEHEGALYGICAGSPALAQHAAGTAHPTRKVVLERDHTGFGFSIVGNDDEDNVCGGIFVFEVKPNTPAARCPEFTPGLKILSINDNATVGVPLATALDYLMGAGTTVAMLVCPDPPAFAAVLRDLEDHNDHDDHADDVSSSAAEQLGTVTLKRGAQGFGLKLASVLGGPGARVADVPLDGPAAATNLVRVGDAIVAINGTNVEAVPYSAVIQLLQQHTTVTLTLRHSQ